MKKRVTKQKDEFISYDELEKQFGIVRGTAYSMVHKRQIPHYRLGARLVRFKKVEIEKWLNSKRVEVS